MKRITSLILVFALPLAHADLIDWTRRPDGIIPRTVNWCASLLSERATEVAPPSKEDLRRRVLSLKQLAKATLPANEFGALMEKLVTTELDLSRHQGRHFAAIHVVTGADNIRQYVETVATDANQLDQALNPETAKAPFAARSRMALHTFSLAAMTAVVALAVKGADTMYVHGYHKTAGLAAGFIALSIYRDLVPVMRAMFTSFRNSMLLRKSFDPGRLPNLMTVNDLRDPRGPEFGAAVLSELETAPSQDAVAEKKTLFTSFSVALPLSRSMTKRSHRLRLAPTDTEINAAVTSSASFPLPADFRWLKVFQTFHVDPEDNQPVLMTFVRELKYPTDGSF